jgi:hypothetical protein
MKHKYETRVVTHVHTVDGEVSYYVEKRKWFWGLLPLEGWLYVAASYAKTPAGAKTKAVECLKNLTRYANDHGAVTWKSNTLEVK